MMAETISGNVESLTNAGNIQADTIDLTAAGNVKNIGGTIKGKDVSLTSTGGSVTNTAYVNEKSHPQSQWQN